MSTTTTSSTLKIKVCGMKILENIQEVSMRSPDYLGFIFYKKSPRDVSTLTDLAKKVNALALPKHVKKTGVFVNASIEEIHSKMKLWSFDALQLHGSEPPEFCKKLKDNYPNIEIFKVFGIKDQFDFSTLEVYEDFIDYFLFDTKGPEKGGNGFVFDWSVLSDYSSKKPFILSGGIGINELEKIKQLLKTNLPVYAIDLNSKFEINPGLKNTQQLDTFFDRLKNN